MSDVPDDRRVLYRGGNIYTPEDPFASAMLIEGQQIAWLGGEGGAQVFAETADEVVELQGALVAPAFVDAHVHLTATGLTHIGLDLSGARSGEEVLTMVRRHTESSRGHGMVLGFGWDEQRWPEQHPPDRTDLDRAAYGGAVLLERVDVHSSLASSAMIAAFPGLAQMSGYDPSGWLRGEAHHRVRAGVHAELPEPMRVQAQRAALHIAARNGIAVVHEMAGAAISSRADVDALRTSASGSTPRVLVYWSQLEGESTVTDLGCHGAGGDLFVDGTLGSRTACLRQPYRDGGGRGEAFLDAAQVRDHLLDCTRAGRQTGFHVIGDAALDTVLAGAAEAAAQVGPGALSAMRHRLEHMEMVHPEQIADIAAYGFVASMQPSFDALWGGAEGMYAERIGERWRLLNPFSSLMAAGVPLAFSSDSPVTPLSPWGAVRSAAFHHNHDQRISVRAAFSAHTRGGWRASRLDGGVLRVGAAATFAVWRTDDLVVQAPDERVAAWSTDPRSGTPGLPDLTPGRPLPECLRTVLDGVVLFDALQGEDAPEDAVTA